MLERRTYEQIEIRAEQGEDNKLRLIGHAAVFNKRSEEIFGFREIVLPGAFKESIKKNDIRALWNHEPAFILGRNKAGTLRLKEDDQGLRTEIDLPDTQLARDLYTSVKRGDVDQMSFGFRTITDAWRKQDGVTIRELVQVELFDVSPVTYPAYPQTDLNARSFYEARMKAIEEPKEDPEPVIVAPLIEDPGVLSFAEILRRARIVKPANAGESEQEKLKRESEERKALRLKFLDDRLPKPDPFSYAEILRKTRVSP